MTLAISLLPPILGAAVSLRNRVTFASLVVFGIGLAIVGVTLNLVLANRLSAGRFVGAARTRRRPARHARRHQRTAAVQDGSGDATLDQQA